ncbi:MAG: glycosyltransferase [Planctomycetota bacterium]
MLPHKGCARAAGGGGDAAARQGVPFRLAVHGGGRRIPAPWRRVARQGQRLGSRWAGPFLPAEIDALLAPVDVLVVPSLWYENSPVTIQDARVRGVPALVSDIGALPELVPEARLRFRVGDAEDLARAMAALVEAGRAGLADLEQGPMPPDPAEESRNTLKHYRALCR